MTVVVTDLPIHENKEEVHLKNEFKKELQSASKPFNVMQAVYILSMYRVRHGFIIPNSVFYNVVSGIWSLLLIVSYFFSLFKPSFIDGVKGFNFIKCAANIVMFSVYSFGSVTNYWTNVTQRHKNVKLAINIQNICEMLNVNGISLKNFTILNWSYVIALIIFRVLWTLNLIFVYSIVFEYDEIVTKLFYIIFDVKMLYSLRLIKFLTKSLKLWVHDAWKPMPVENNEKELHWNKQFRVYMEIVETYEIVGQSFQTVVLYHCIDTFTNSVLSIWIRIEIVKTLGINMFKIVLSLLSLLWLVKSMILVKALCLECERFYSMMAEVRATCLYFTTSETCPETQKRVCKNIQRIQTVRFKKMTACGLFIIDGTLPLLLSGLVTTYIIVVLQFEYL